MKIENLVKSFDNIKNKFKQEDGWCLYVSIPYGRMVYDGRKTMILKDSNITKHIGEELFLCSDKVYGTIVLEEGEVIKKKDLQSMFDEHKITEPEIKERFIEKDVVCGYRFEFTPLSEPVDYFAPKGFNSFMRSDKLKIGRKGKEELSLSSVNKNKLENSTFLELISIHKNAHNLFNTKKISNKEIYITIHGMVAKEMVNRGYKFNIIDELDQKSYKEMNRE